MRFPVRSVVGSAVLALLLAATLVHAQDPDDAGAQADSLAAAQDQVGSPPPPGGYRTQGFAQGLQVPAGTGFFTQVLNAPKAGVRATVQQYQYYSQWETSLLMRSGASLDNTLGWSWADYRKQDKTIEKREDQLTWNAGQQLPLTTSIVGNWDWSEDKTVNSAGVANLAKRDYLRGSLNLSKTKLQTGSFVHGIRGMGTVEDQKSLNQSQRNDFAEATGSVGAQSAWQIAKGLTMAGRLWGSTTSGSRTLGEEDAPSSASGDTVGLGVYYEQHWAGGRVHVSRANFDKRYLDYRKNSNGLIDTTGYAEDEKVVSELETKDAMSVEFENVLRLGRIKLDTALGRTSDDLDYAASGKGLTERESDRFAAALSFGAGRDSFMINYDWLWKWDDQRYKNATANRGKQYVKSRDFAVSWFREVFSATDMTLKLHQGLNQDSAENGFNDNDKDRVASDLNLKFERAWTGFRTQLAFNYNEVEDLSLNSSRSSGNNVKDSYEIAPGYTWDLADWLMLTQSYRLYIQYTDYVYSDLPDVSRNDDYNKRGIINTVFSIDVSEQLALTVKHDYNKRFNATRTSTDAAGSSAYSKDQVQTNNKINLALKYEAAEGVVLEAATFRAKDDKQTFGVTDRITTTFSGEIWVGAQVRKKWGTENPLELSAMVRKYNAYGPSITETSADYWDADVWLKWSF